MNDTGKENERDMIDGINALEGTNIWDNIGNATRYTINEAESSPVVVAFTDGADN